jgi:hypothetical protein
MAKYALGGNQASIASSYKGVVASWCPASNTKRHKWFEFVLGATANPNATDTYIQVDISRLSQTTSLAGTAATPNALDPADGAALIVAATNETTEPSAALIATSLFNTGLNQRATTRWIAADESFALVAPATAVNGLYMRAQSSTYNSTFDGQVSYHE